MCWPGLDKGPAAAAERRHPHSQGQQQRPGQPHPPTFAPHEGPAPEPPYCCDFVFASADLLELLYRMVRDEAELRRVLVDNPAALFGYEAPGEAA